MTSSLSKCISCRARIYWLSTIGGKKMPVDAQPTNAGTVILTDKGAQVLTGMFLDAARNDDDERLYMPHFATCPSAARHRLARV